MATRSKRKGNFFEREIVNEAKERGFTSKRAYASNGLALGECEETDLLLSKERIQAKRRKSIASYLYPPDKTDAVATRADQKETLFILDKELYYHMLACKMMIQHLLDTPNRQAILKHVELLEVEDPEVFIKTLTGEFYDKD